ncbi:prolyl oligopeptidase family serine peptidase [Psychrosphaera sp. F3M07]|uniref:alpha/beta hydrolase n=1 Tax=Psychrosphaera sp. F3M07 TaxID=2841560 RepID=UPI001C08CA74|nr:alpha/beta hydrolase-fold protein [Psychrosphaera sp. F3M07]MBU2918857.1 prolyl oligopeptidase family serine peptidase [Psychrosphaera sp. F3M07]
MTIQRIEISNSIYAQPNTTKLTIFSSHINSRQDVSVYHNCYGKTDVPIIVLLHGVYGSNWVWMELGGVHQVLEQLKSQGVNDFILVMPSDGGLWEGSGYLPLTTHGDYEQWILDDVLTAVKQNIPEASERSNLYITGLSMGGYGALRLGVKYPSLFQGISAHSAVTSLEDLQQFIQNPITDYQCEFEHESNLVYWLGKNAKQLPPIRLDCGSDDSLFTSNLALTNAMATLGLKFTFDRYSGGHEWAYWHKHIATTITFFDQIEKS